MVLGEALSLPSHPALRTVPLLLLVILERHAVLDLVALHTVTAPGKRSTSPFDRVPPPIVKGEVADGDFLQTGRLATRPRAWPRGTWAGRVVRRGLSWTWGARGRPALRRPPPCSRVSPAVLLAVQDMLRKEVVERVTGRVFLSRPFTVPRRDRPEPRFVLDLSYLNKFIPCHRFKMLTISHVRSSLLPQAWFTSLDLQSAYWHVPIHRRFRPYLAFQANEDVFQFRVLPFGLNIAPRVFTKLTRVVAARLVDEGVNVLMYLDDWVIQAPTKELCSKATALTITLAEDMGFAFNLPKSCVVPSREIAWLGLVWDSATQTLRLSDTNRAKVVNKIRLSLCSRTYTKRQWASLMGTLNHAAQTLPLGRLWFRRLSLEGNRVFQRPPLDRPVPMPHRLKPLLRRWLDAVVTRRTVTCNPVPWMPPPPVLWVCTDASDIGWGYQASDGRQGRGTWDEELRRSHINLRELLVVVYFLRDNPLLENVSIGFRMDNVAAVQCVARMGSSRSVALLETSEVLFETAFSRGITLSAVHLAGQDNVWADALSRARTSSVEWSLDEDAFQDLLELAGPPDIDLFASQDNHRLPLYLSRTYRTSAGGPDAFQVDWNRWGFIYLFPPPSTSLLLQVCHRLRTYKGRVMLVAPLWKSQPWCHQLLQWCPSPLPLGPQALRGDGVRQSGISCDFHAWIF